ncbi:sensor histidine kinase [Yinghuangia soli]|uniref:Oxygen sensor histidine kinase NreB n=1 Tax=Yinghuangia soli TaxID=2908204 RepID=A0AA41U1P1_9ACTN|nr:sensor histidine kinase [Yinghuangia soli]MCF2527762.1 sensor histidine kinase [Yinghuangia soli]
MPAPTPPPSADPAAPASPPVPQNAADAPAMAVIGLMVHAMFGALLVIAAIRTAAVGDPSAGTVACSSALALLTAAWYALGALRTRGPHTEGRTRVLWLLGLTGLWVLAVAVSVEYIWVAFPLFLLHLYLLPPVPALSAVAALTAVSAGGYAWHTGELSVPAVLGPATGAVVAAVMMYVYRALHREGEERRRLLTDLVAAQVRLAAHERESGRLAERERLAREIHDTVAQSLSSIVLLLRAARDPATAPEAAREQLDVAADTARSALDEARRFVAALAPAALDGRALTEALDRLTAEAGALGADARFAVEGDDHELPVPVEAALLRIAQGALANVRAHAGARTVRVTLTYQPDEVRLDIVDDGRGFDPAAPRDAGAEGTGFGLRAMRARLAEIGGALTVESASGEGTAIGATVPLLTRTAEDAEPERGQAPTDMRIDTTPRGGAL